MPRHPPCALIARLFSSSLASYIALYEVFNKNSFFTLDILSFAFLLPTCISRMRVRFADRARVGNRIAFDYIFSDVLSYSSFFRTLNKIFDHFQYSVFKVQLTTFALDSLRFRFARHGLRPIRLCSYSPHQMNLFGLSAHIRARLIAFVEMERFELLTPCLQGRCSPN